MYHFASSSATHKDADFPTSSPALVIFQFSDHSHSGTCGVEPPCGFALPCISLVTKDVQHLFRRLLVNLLWRHVCSNPVHILLFGYLPLVLELLDFMYARYRSLIQYVICKYFVPSCVLSFHVFDNAL